MARPASQTRTWPGRESWPAHLVGGEAMRMPRAAPGRPRPAAQAHGRATGGRRRLVAVMASPRRPGRGLVRTPSEAARQRLVSGRRRCASRRAGLPWPAEGHMEETTATGTHRPLGQHPHTHDRFCGHAAVPHDATSTSSTRARPSRPRRPRRRGGRSRFQRRYLPCPPRRHSTTQRAGCGHAAYPTRITWTTCTIDHRHAGHHVHYDEHMTAGPDGRRGRSVGDRPRDGLRRLAPPSITWGARAPAPPRRGARMLRVRVAEDDPECLESGRRSGTARPGPRATTRRARRRDLVVLDRLADCRGRRDERGPRSSSAAIRLEVALLPPASRPAVGSSEDDESARRASTWRGRRAGSWPPERDRSGWPASDSTPIVRMAQATRS